MEKILIVFWFLVVKTLTAQEAAYTVDDLLNNGITASAKSTSEKSLNKTSIAKKIIMERSCHFEEIVAGVPNREAHDFKAKKT